MALLRPLVLLSVGVCVLGLRHVDVTTESPALSPLDSFCQSGGLEIIYPEISINKCLTISNDFREKISKVWTAPKIRFSSADKKKKYVLTMVDPDAPRPSNPTRAYWRHWLVVDVKGNALRNGDLHCTILSEYVRPTPPPKSGFHRYQFILFEQPAGKSLSLTGEEKSSLGNWNPRVFIKRFDLGEPVASVQFLTQNHED